MSPVLRRTVEIFTQRIAEIRADQVKVGLLDGSPNMLEHGINVGIMRCLETAEKTLAEAVQQAIHEDDPEDGNAG